MLTDLSVSISLASNGLFDRPFFFFTKAFRAFFFSFFPGQISRPPGGGWAAKFGALGGPLGIEACTRRSESVSQHPLVLAIGFQRPLGFLTILGKGGDPIGAKWPWILSAVTPSGCSMLQSGI